MLLVIWQKLTCQVSDLASTQGSWLAVAMGYAALAGICCCPLCSRSHYLQFGNECMRDARRKWWPTSLGRLGEVDFFWEGTQRLTRHFGMFEYSKKASSGTEGRNMRNKLITHNYTMNTLWRLASCSFLYDSWERYFLRRDFRAQCRHGQPRKGGKWPKAIRLLRSMPTSKVAKSSGWRLSCAVFWSHQASTLVCHPVIVLNVPSWLRQGAQQAQLHNGFGSFGWCNFASSVRGAVCVGGPTCLGFVG